MLGRMGLGERELYPRDAVERIRRGDAARRMPDPSQLKRMLSVALATSDLLEEDWRGLALETGLMDRNVEKGVIMRPLILGAVRNGMAEAMAGGSAAGMTRLPLRQCR